MEIISNILERQQKAEYSPLQDEFEENGIIYCKQCKTPRSAVSSDGKHKARCLCKCQKQEYEEEKRKEEELKRLKAIEDLKTTSLIGERYKNVSFDNTEIDHNESFKTAYNRLKTYCKVSDEALRQGWGVYLYGDKGVGKSHLTACMANELINQYKQVLFTNFSEIARKLRSSFKDSEEETNFILLLSNIDFLFIDDIGVERVQTKEGDLWMQEKVYEIINKRYNNKKPTIFTSNYSLKELVSEKGLSERTVDRIGEMSNAIIKISGDNYRRKARDEIKILF